MLGLDFYVKAYQELRSPDYIRWHDIIEWCKHYGLSHEQTETTVRFVRAMDDERAKAEMKKNG